MKHFLLSLFLLVLFSQSFSQQKQKPNILFILTDDLGIGDIGVYHQQKLKEANKPHIETPGLDKLASEGVTLTQNYANAPVCAPSRASFLSGLTQGHSNVRNNQFDKALEDNYTVANTLKQAGYKTFAIGKWGLQGGEEKEDTPEAWVAHPLNRGFDYFFGYIRHIDGHEHYPKEGPARGRKELYENRTDITDKLDKCYTGDLFTAITKKAIIDHRKKNPKQPFFMFLSFDTPHAATQVGTQKYPDGKGLNGGIQYIGTPGKYINTASGEIDSWIDPNVANATYDHDNDSSTPQIAWPDVYKRYATMVQRIDNQVEDILQLLKDLHIDDNTLVVFTSDNGASNESYIKENFHPTFFESSNGFDGLKRDVWEGGIRVPALVKWRGTIPSGKINHTPSMTSDWLNTFLDAASMPLLYRSDGVSLLPALTEKKNQKESLVYVEYFNNSKTPAYKSYEMNKQNKTRNEMQAVRIGNYMGVRYDIKNHSDNFEIYDVVKDPKQIYNLATTAPQFFSLQKQMKDKVLQSRRPNATAKRPYDKELVPAIEKKPLNEYDDVWYLRKQFFAGNYSWLPGIDLPEDKNPFTIPTNRGKTKAEIAKKIKGSKKQGVTVVEGCIHIPEDGEYIFSLKANKGAVLKLHNILLIDADYNYSPQSEKKESILLKKGLHPFKLLYKNTTKKANDVVLDWRKN